MVDLPGTCGRGEPYAAHRFGQNSPDGPTIPRLVAANTATTATMVDLPGTCGRCDMSNTEWRGIWRHTSDPAYYIYAADPGHEWGTTVMTSYFEILHCTGDDDGLDYSRAYFEVWGVDDGVSGTTGLKVSDRNEYLIYPYREPGYWCCGEVLSNVLHVGPDIALTCTEPYRRSEYFPDEYE